ncbi:MAG: hypothetical protein ACK411_15325, partial [Exiguobacterium mexicanum]
MMADTPTCFIMMPISTPASKLETYGDDQLHFLNILEHLIVPAVERAGFIPILPTVEGSLVIHAEIIRNLCVADMALADMSILNPNVFFEMGIRTAVNKPLSIIIDDKTEDVPFDTNLIAYKKYDSSASAWKIDEERETVARHIKDTYEKSRGTNGLWSAFNATSHLTRI